MSLNSQEVTQIDITPVTLIRDRIIQDLSDRLSSIATTQIYDIYLYNADEMPLIVIEDGEDTIDSINFESIKHELEVTLNLFSVGNSDGFKQNSKLISDTLEVLKEFKSNFIKKEFIEIDRLSVEISGDNFIKAILKFKFTYITSVFQC